MYKRALAFLLATVLAFTPVLSVNAAETTSSIRMTEMMTEVSSEEADPAEKPEVSAPSEETQAPEETQNPGAVSEESAMPEETQVPIETSAPAETNAPEETPEAEVPSAEPAASATPEETPGESATPEAEPIESEAPAESTSPEESAVPEETPEENATPEETPEESLLPDESASPEESLSPEESATPEEDLEEEELVIDTDLETVITEDIDLTLSAGDAQGEGWTWKASTKTLTLNGYQSAWKMILPGESTIKLAKGSKNIVDTTLTDRYGFYADGNLTVTGPGKLKVRYYKYEPIYAKGTTTIVDTNLQFENTGNNKIPPLNYEKGYVTVIGSDISMKTKGWSVIMGTRLTLEGCQLVKGRISNDYYYADINAETGFYEFEIKRAPLYIAKHPAGITKLNVGKSANLSVTAKSSIGKTLKYQWYSTKDYKNPVNGAVKVVNATSAKLKVTPKDRGIVYYYCEISDGKNKVLSDLAAVVTAKKGYKLHTENFNITKTTESVDKLAEEGWKWDKDNLTLTLKNFDYQVPYGKGNGFRIPLGITVVVEDTSYLDPCSGELYFSTSQGTDTCSVFKGPGTLHMSATRFNYSTTDYTIIYSDGIKVEAVEFGNESPHIILDNASVYAREHSILKKGTFTMRNGSYLEMASSFRVWNDITIGRGCKLVCGGYVECFGDLLIEEDAEMIIEKNLVMNSSSSSYQQDRTITINGTLHIKPQSYAYQAINFYSTTANPLKLGSGVRVIYPEGAVWDNKVKSNSSYYYGYKYNGSYELNGLTIGKEAKTSKKITGSKNITGTPKYQSILKAPALDQKNATVSYQWQYADTPNGPWDNMSVSDVQSTYQVATKYHGRYLRVVTKGIGAYSGEIYSNPVGPVVGNQGALYGLWTEADGIKYQVGYDTFDGDETSQSVSTHVSKNGTFRYHAMPINKNATVTFRNLTTGFSKVGKDVDIPVVEGKNKIEVEVVSGLKKTTYQVDHTVKKVTELLSIGTSGYGVTLTATWTDENGQQSMSVGSNASTSKYLPLGTEVTITSTCPTGEYADFYEGVSEKPDKTKPGNPVTFIHSGMKSVRFSSNDTKAFPPEDLSASWQFEQGTAEIKVKAIPVPDTSPTQYVEIELEVQDAEGNYKWSGEVGGAEGTADADGYHRIEVPTLDCTQKYKVWAKQSGASSWYFDTDESVSYTLMPRKQVTLTTKPDHVVLKPGESISVPILYDGYEEGQLFLTNSFDKEVIRSTAAIKKNASGENELQITAKGEGTTYLTIRGDDYKKPDAMQYVYTMVRVDVIAADEAPPIRLGKKTGTLNLYDDSALTIPVYEMECGHEIDSAVFAEEALNEKFAISVVNDRTLKVIPKVPEDDGVIDYAKWIAESGRTGTFSSKIKVIYNGAVSRESDEKLKITLTAKKPEIKVSALNFSSFYTEQTKDLKVSVKGETVAKIEIDTAKNTDSTVAIPEYLSLNGADKSITFDGNKVPTNSLTTGIYLKVWPEGYRIPLQKKVNVTVSYQKPKIKFNKATITVPAERPKESVYFDLRLLPADKNVKYEDLKVLTIRGISNLELKQLSQKQRKNHINMGFFERYDLSPSSGIVRFMYDYSYDPVPGKATFFVNVDKGKEPVKVSLTVKTVKNSKVMANKKTITMNNAFGTYSAVNRHEVNLTTNVSAYEMKNSVLSATVYKVGDATKKDYSSSFDIFWDSYDGRGKLVISRSGSTPPVGTYKMSVYCKEIKKPAVITIKVVSEKPTLKLSIDKKEISISRIKEEVFRKEKITFSVPAKLQNSYGFSEATIIRPDGSEYNFTPSSYSEGTDGNIIVSGIGVNYANNTKSCSISIAEGAVTGTYKVVFRACISGADNSSTLSNKATVTVKVTDAAPAPKITPAQVTLNKDLGEYDKVTLELKKSSDYLYRKINGTEFPWEVTSIKNSKGKDATNELYYNIALGKLEIITNENTKYGENYKVKVALCYANDVKKSTTVTVQIPKKNATISASVKVKGSIDLARPVDAEKSQAMIQYTVKNWNEGVYGDALDGAYYEWEVYAKNGKKAVTTKDGAINDKGLVANGTSFNGEAENTDWFYNRAQDSVGLMINYNSTAWQSGLISPGYTYTVKAKLKFKYLDKSVTLPSVTLKVKNGSVKFGQDKKAVTLVKPDEKGRAFITVDIKNYDYKWIQPISAVEVVSDKKVPVSKAIEIKPIYNVNNKYIYEVRWKNDTAVNVKSGNVKLNVYLEGNNPKWKKPNTTLSLKVNVK